MSLDFGFCEHCEENTGEEFIKYGYLRQSPHQATQLEGLAAEPNTLLVPKLKRQFL